MRASILVCRDFVSVDVYGAVDCDVEFFAIRDCIRRAGIVCFTGASCASSFSVKVDCRLSVYPETERHYWADRRRAILGLLTMYCVEKYGRVDIVRAEGWIDGIDLSKTENQEKTS